MYFDQNGYNANTGFIAFIECLTNDGNSVRRKLTTGCVPNIANWESLFTTTNDSALVTGSLLPENNRTLSVADNNLFVWAFNLFPFGTVQRELMRLAEVAVLFKCEKKRIQKEPLPFNNGDKKVIRDQVQKRIGDLKEELLRQVDESNIVIAQELKRLFSILTNV